MSIFNNGVNTEDLLPELQGQEEGAADTNNDENSSPETQGQDEQDNGEQPAEDTKTNGTISTEKLYAGKFKTVEDMEKAYANAEAFGTKTAQELSKLRKQVANPNPQANHAPQSNQTSVGTQPAYNQQGNDAVVNEITKRIVSSVTNAYNPLLDRVQLMEDKDVLSTLAMNDPDNFKDVAPSITKTIEENPWILQAPNYVEVAYKLAKTQVLEQKMQDKIASVRDEAYKSKDLKVLNSDSVTRAKQQSNTEKTPEQEIADSILNVSNRKLRI
jgi:hypothetical protein